jgi:hypothetical protein
MPSYPEKSQNKNAISLIKNSSLFFKSYGKNSQCLFNFEFSTYVARTAGNVN